nr:MAG TPA: hypothetical protein [Caudoviricetes sp.]
MFDDVEHRPTHLYTWGLNSHYKFTSSFLTFHKDVDTHLYTSGLN